MIPRRVIRALDAALTELLRTDVPPAFDEQAAGDYLATQNPSADVPPTSTEDDPAAVFDPLASAAGSLNFVDWATPAICDVLAAHRPHEYDDERGGGIRCRAVWAADHHASFSTWQDWRVEHVAPLIAERLHQSARASASLKAADERVEAAIMHAECVLGIRAMCIYCDEPIRAEDGSAYHVETGLARCAMPFSTYAYPK